jgi:hypothetical protein
MYTEGAALGALLYTEGDATKAAGRVAGLLGEATCGDTDASKFAASCGAAASGGGGGGSSTTTNSTGESTATTITTTTSQTCELEYYGFPESAGFAHFAFANDALAVCLGADFLAVMQGAFAVFTDYSDVPAASTDAMRAYPLSLRSGDGAAGSWTYWCFGGASTHACDVAMDPLTTLFCPVSDEALRAQAGLSGYACGGACADGDALALGDGDCNEDSDCGGGLFCGLDNCAAGNADFDAADDCCTACMDPSLGPSLPGPDKHMRTVRVQLWFDTAQTSTAYACAGLSTTLYPGDNLLSMPAPELATCLGAGYASTLEGGYAVWDAYDGASLEVMKPSYPLARLHESNNVSYWCFGPAGTEFVGVGGQGFGAAECTLDISPVDLFFGGAAPATGAAVTFRVFPSPPLAVTACGGVTDYLSGTSNLLAFLGSELQACVGADPSSLLERAYAVWPSEAAASLAAMRPGYALAHSFDYGVWSMWCFGSCQTALDGGSAAATFLGTSGTSWAQPTGAVEFHVPVSVDPGSGGPSGGGVGATLVASCEVRAHVNTENSDGSEDGYGVALSRADLLNCLGDDTLPAQNTYATWADLPGASIWVMRPGYTLRSDWTSVDQGGEWTHWFWLPSDAGYTPNPMCSDTCADITGNTERSAAKQGFANDGYCDDYGPGHHTPEWWQTDKQTLGGCMGGTDCSDCGTRYIFGSAESGYYFASEGAPTAATSAIFAARPMFNPLEAFFGGEQAPSTRLHPRRALTHSVPPPAHPLRLLLRSRGRGRSTSTRWSPDAPALARSRSRSPRMRTIPHAPFPMCPP